MEISDQLEMWEALWMVFLLALSAPTMHNMNFHIMKLESNLASNLGLKK